MVIVYNRARNCAAHDTQVAFAKLPVSPTYQNTHKYRYHYWGGLYPFCYGKTVEEVALSDDNDEEDEEFMKWRLRAEPKLLRQSKCF